MFKLVIFSILLISNSQAIDFIVIDITTEPSFNYFASLQLWLLIISAPMFLVLGLFKHLRKVVT